MLMPRHSLLLQVGKRTSNSNNNNNKNSNSSHITGKLVKPKKNEAASMAVDVDVEYEPTSFEDGLSLLLVMIFLRLFPSLLMPRHWI